MPPLKTLAAALSLGITLPGMALATCTEAQAEAKMVELAKVMGPLMARNAALSQTIATNMQAVMLQPTSDQTCPAYDRLIARAKAGR